MNYSFKLQNKYSENTLDYQHFNNINRTLINQSVLLKIAVF